MKTKLATIFLIILAMLAPGVVEAKNIVKIGSDVTVLEEQQVDNVVVLGGQITVSGLVEKNVLAVGGSVVLTNKAVVRGNVVAVGGVVAQGSGSLVFGDITEINLSALSGALQSVMQGELSGWSIILNIISLCFFVIILMVALLMAFLLPRQLTAVANVIANQRIKSFFCGLLGTLMIVPFFMLLAISIIGIFLMPLVFASILLAAMIGFIACGFLLGNLIMTRILPGRQPSPVKATLTGLCLLWLLGWLPFHIGVIIKLLAITLGLGGVLLTLANGRTKISTDNRL